MQKIVLLILMAVVVGCTKSNPPAGSSSPHLSQAEKTIFEADLIVPTQFKTNLKRTDLLIWDLKTAEGVTVAAQMMPVPNFPFHLTVQSSQLQKPLAEKAVLLFSARVVSFGDERKPPAKGQLSVLMGSASDAEVVKNPAVDQKRFEKWAKKNRYNEAQLLTVGSKVKAEFAPILW